MRPTPHGSTDGADAELVAGVEYGVEQLLAVRAVAGDQVGTDPAGIGTQDPRLRARLDPVIAGRRLATYLDGLTLETPTLARACGKSHITNLEPEDLAALTMEAAAMAQVPIASTDWIPGDRRK